MFLIYTLFITYLLMRKGRRPGPFPKKGKLVPKKSTPRDVPRKAPKLAPRKQYVIKEEPVFEAEIEVTVGQISKVRFTVPSYEYMKNIGAPEITSSVIPNIDAEKSEIAGTIYDPRMGPSSYWKKKCAQCGQDNKCMGHMGYMLLQTPMINPAGGIILKRLLNIICGKCGEFHIIERIFHTMDLSKYSVGQRLNILEQNIPSGGKSKYQCHIVQCGEVHVPVTFVKETNKLQRGNKELAMRDILDLIESVNSTQQGRHMLNTLGIPDINVFLISIIGIIPPIMRETVRKGAVDVYKDPLRDVYKKIIAINNKIVEERSIAGKDDLIDKLHMNILYLFEGAKTGAYKFPWIQEKRDYKSILGSKEGHIRHLQMGNRVDHTLRSVLTIDPGLDLGKIKVSSTLMDYMYKEEYITTDTLPFYKELLDKKQLIHYTPGSGQYKDKKYEIAKQQFDIELFPGAKVTRRLKDGDLFMFGRNPSIHTPSVMSHQMISDPDVKTIAIHTATTSPYNADCDGDEGHAKIIQTYLAIAEAKYVTNVIYNTISSETSDVNMGLVIDNLNSIFTMTAPFDMGYSETRPDIYDTISKDLTNIDDNTTYDSRLEKYNISTSSARGLLSKVLPFAFQYSSKSPDGMPINITDGILVRGALSKKTVGVTRSSRNIGRYLSHFWGNPRHAEFLTVTPRLVNYWLSEQRGATVGISDAHLNDPVVLIPKKHTLDQIRQTIRILDQPASSKIEETRIENEIVSIIGQQIEGLGRKLTRQALSGPTNNFQAMYLSGAKGDLFHITQMTALLGQQYLSGQRLPKTLNNGKRGSIYAHRNSSALEDRGFITHSLGEGISPKEMESHSRSVRENLYNMTTTTAPTGDLHHRFAKAMEDVVTQYDGTVRDTNGVIIDFLVAGVGIDPRRPLLVTHNNITASWFTDSSVLIDILNSEIEFERESIKVPVY